MGGEISRRGYSLHKQDHTESERQNLRDLSWQQQDLSLRPLHDQDTTCFYWRNMKSDY